MFCPCTTRLLIRHNFIVSPFKNFVSTLNHVPDSPVQIYEESPNCISKLLKVAIVGMPNAGKSTIINSLMDRKVCATSSKVHTTRTRARAIFNSENTQIIFIDSPGLVTDREQKKFNLQKVFVKDSKAVYVEADIIGVIHDVSNIWTREKLDIKIIKLLEKHKKKPSFLVLNKIDMLKSKRKLLDLVKILTENSIKGKIIDNTRTNLKEGSENKGWPYFNDIFMVSALQGDGLEDIKNYLVTNAQPGEWMFPEYVFTDQDPKSLIVNTVKAALLNHMPQELPYKLQPVIEYFKVDEATGKINTVVLIKCPTSRIAQLVSGAADGRLRILTESVQRDLQNAFQTFVKIQIVPVCLIGNK